MAANKTFTELPSGGVPQGTDISGLDRVGSVESLGWTFSDALTYVSENLPVGAVITFPSGVPTGGNNGDVAWRLDESPNYKIYQKVSGIWTVKVTITTNAADGTLLYGNGVPDNSLGKQFDSYLNKLNGAFYLKGAVSWTIQYIVPTSSPGLLLSVTLDGSGEYDFTANGIREFPTVAIYDSVGNITSYFYNNTTKKITNGTPDEAINVRFI